MSAWIVYSKDGQTERCKLKKLEYSGSFMNERTVTATFEYHSEVAFEVFDYIVYRGEKFELEAIPSVKKTSSMDYQYELRFVSLKYELERCEMRDIVPSDNGITYPTPLTFSFTGDVRYLTERIQANLDALYGQGVWSIVVSDDVESEEKNITIAQQNCWNALSLVNTTYGLNFSIKGRVVTIGGNQSTVGHTFQYGKGNGLYEIERNSDTDTGIVTKLRAYGGTRNLDYSYPKKPEWADSVLPVSFILSPLRLMLPSFKEDGKTDYILADEATISEYGIREASVIYDDIYPSITGATNSRGQKIDEIMSVEPIDDSASTFVVYLHNLEFDLESQLMTDNAQISMKSGAMQGYTFNISEIERISNNFYKITLGRITTDESDTGNYDIPNSSWHMEAGDKFVFLNILMPQKYIRDAEERLLKRAQEYLAEYGKTNFSYNVGLHDKFLKEHEAVYNELVEGAKLSVYDSELGISENVTIQSITITEYADDNILPQVKVTLNNKPSASTLERIQGQIKELSETSAGQFSTQSELLKQYRRKLDKPFFDRLFAAVDFDGNEIPSTDMTTPIAYIKARFNFATLGGVTMYLDDKSLNLPSIYDGLPIDHNTIYWENGVLKAKVGSGTGGVDESAVRTLIESYDYATKDFVRDYVLQNATGGEFELSKQMVIDALGFTPYSAENPNGYITAASIPSALKNPYALTFGSKTYDGSSAKEITASDLGAALSSDLSKYLPLTGGTVNGIIYLNNTSSQGSRISFKNNRTSESSWADNVINATDVNGNVIMRFGLYGTTDAFNYIFLGHNAYTGNNLRIYTDKVTFGSNAIWHAGNDGSGSGLDADLLDGVELNKLTANIFKRGIVDELTANTDLDELTYGNDKLGYYSADDNVKPTNAPTTNFGLLSVSLNTFYTGQLIMGYGNTGRMYYRSQYYGDSVKKWSQWEKIAYVTDNVASATKLQTARTIWGQSFDGSGNVRGALSGVTGIVFNDANYGLSIDQHGNFSFKKPSSSVAVNWSFKDSSGNKLLIFKNNGNLGIGKTDPAYPLDVNGRIRAIILEATERIHAYCIAHNLNDVWSDGTNTHPWYGYDHRYQNTGVYSTTISDYFGMTLRTANIGVFLTQTNMGVGISTPSKYLHIGGTFGNDYVYANFNTANPYLALKENSNTWYVQGLSNYLCIGSTSSKSLKIDANGNVLVTGGLTMQSQRSLKNVVDEKGLSLTELSAIKPTRYTWIDKRDEKIHFGGIADDIERVLPEVIYKTVDGTLTMDYGNAGFAIASSLIKPVIDHETKIRMLEIRVKELEEELKRYSA